MNRDEILDLSLDPLIAQRGNTRVSEALSAIEAADLAGIRAKIA